MPKVLRTIVACGNLKFQGRQPTGNFSPKWLLGCHYFLLGYSSFQLQSITCLGWYQIILLGEWSTSFTFVLFFVLGDNVPTLRALCYFNVHLFATMDNCARGRSRWHFVLGPTAACPDVSARRATKEEKGKETTPIQNNNCSSKCRFYGMWYWIYCDCYVAYCMQAWYMMSVCCTRPLAVCGSLSSFRQETASCLTGS